MTLLYEPNIPEAIKELDASNFKLVGDEPTNETEFAERITFYTDSTAQTVKESPVTWTQVETKYNEMMVAYNNEDYARNRAKAYDTLGNQLDKLFHDIDEGKLDKTGSFYLGIKTVKDSNPK
tara:strand:- start:2175 stop:2540 length:366 start_codon:yes stop_codon:yes gene_type:complete